MKPIGNQQNVPFPRKLYELIQTEPDTLVEWSARGDSFFIRDQDEFCQRVLPKYFRHTKLTSFQRQLNLYGFRRITKGPDTGAYFHPSFHQDSPHLVESIKRMVRKNSGDQTATAAAAVSSSGRGGGRGGSGTPSWSQQQMRSAQEQEERERQLSRQQLQHQQRLAKSRGRSRSHLSRQLDVQKQLETANSPSSPHSFPDTAPLSYSDHGDLMDEEALPSGSGGAAIPHWPVSPPSSSVTIPPPSHTTSSQPVALAGAGHVFPPAVAPTTLSQSAPAEYLGGGGVGGFENGGGHHGGPGLTRQVSTSFSAHPAFGSIAPSAGFDPGFGLSKSQPQPNSFFRSPALSADIWAVSDDLTAFPPKLVREISGNSDGMALEEWALAEEALGSMDALDDFDFEQTFNADMCPN